MRRLATYVFIGLLATTTIVGRCDIQSETENEKNLVITQIDFHWEGAQLHPIPGWSIIMDEDLLDDPTSNHHPKGTGQLFVSPAQMRDIVSILYRYVRTYDLFTTGWKNHLAHGPPKFGSYEDIQMWAKGGSNFREIQMPETYLSDFHRDAAKTIKSRNPTTAALLWPKDN